MKTYHYTYFSKPQDLVVLGLDHTYHQYTGLINIVFTIAMLILLIARWNAWGILGNIFLVIAFMIFPVFQPLAMYLHGRKVIGPKPSEIDMTIEEDAMHIRSEGKQTTIQWERIAGLVTNGSTHPCVKMEKPYNTAGTGYTDLGYALGGTSGSTRSHRPL